MRCRRTVQAPFTTNCTRLVRRALRAASGCFFLALSASSGISLADDSIASPRARQPEVTRGSWLSLEPSRGVGAEAPKPVPAPGASGIEEQIRDSALEQQQRWDRQSLRRDWRRQQSTPEGVEGIGTGAARFESRLRSMSDSQKRAWEAQQLRRDLRTNP